MVDQEATHFTPFSLCYPVFYQALSLPLFSIQQPLRTTLRTPFTCCSHTQNMVTAQKRISPSIL